jgi:hypothetical protein
MAAKVDSQSKIAKDVIKRARAIADQDDYYVKEWRHHFPAGDGELEEVWFQGRYKGNSRMKIAGDSDLGEYAVFIRPDETGYVVATSEAVE